MDDLQLYNPPGSRRSVPRSLRQSGVAKETSPLLEYVDILRRNKGPVLIVAFVGLIAGIVFTLPQVPIYQARTSLEIQGLNENFLNMKNVDPNAAGEYSTEAYIQTQIKILQSKSLLDRVISKLNMSDHAEPERASRPDAWRKLLGLPAKRAKNLSSRQVLIRRIANNLKVQASGLTRIVELSYDSTDPQQAADLVNTLATEYIDQNMEARWKITQRTSEWLNKQLEDLKIKLEKSNDELQAYARSVGLTLTAEKDNLAEEKLRQVQTELSKAQADRAVKQAQFELVSTSPLEALSDVLNDGSLRDYQLKLTELRRQNAELSTSLTPEHYKVQRLQAQIAELEESLTRQRNNIVRRIQNEFGAAKRREHLLSVDFATSERFLSDQATKAIHYNILKREVDSSRQLYDAMLQKVKEANVTSALKASNIRIIDPAEVPPIPYKPNLATNSALGLFGGAFLGIVLVMVRERSDRTIQVPGDSDFYLNLPELGIIPMAKGIPRVEVVTWEHKPSLLAESFRATLASILFSTPNSTVPKVLVVTSASRSEGKSTVVSNLAIALAEIHRRVLLIDGDMRRPSLHKFFDLNNNPGLSDWLSEAKSSEEVTLQSMVQKTSIPNLSVLPSGAGAVSIINLLYSPRMMELMRHSRMEYDHILIDTPPMLQIPDARVLGRISDGVILVIRAGRTTRDTALAAAQRFTEDSVPVLGTVLNSWDPGKTSSALYQAYGSRELTSGDAFEQS